MAKNTPPTPPDRLDPRLESLPPPPPADRDYRDRLDGVIILVYAGDVYLAKACCASIRQALGDLPITLLVDGPEVNTAELERLPGVHRLVAQEAADPEAVRLCTGFWVKLLVFWLSPYERFLYLDADTLVWGDVRAYAEWDKYDFIAGCDFNTPRLVRTVEEAQRLVFDVAFIKQLDPALDWRGQELANNGVFFARRGVFARANLLELRQLTGWRGYEQGVVNYLRWRALREGVPRATGRPMQVFPAETAYSLADRLLPRGCRHPAIIHWICKKPRLGRRYQAADDFRRLFLQMTGRARFLGARLFLEDLSVWLGRHVRSLTGRKHKS
jgi:hypothetical protein